MAEICVVCNKKFGFMDPGTIIGKIHVHHDCAETLNEDPEKYGGNAKADPEKYGGKAKKELTPSKEDQNKEERIKGMVLIDIDLPFGRVFWVTVQFFVAGLALAIPIWLIIFLLVS